MRNIKHVKYKIAGLVSKCGQGFSFRCTTVFRYYHATCLKGLRKTTQSLGLENMAEYKSENILLE